jgi:DNA-binding CsgD family transcriptional regulator
MLASEGAVSESGTDVLGLLALARAAAEEARDCGVLMLAAINESDVLEGMGEHLRAAEVARSGLAEAARFGLSRTSGAILATNVAEPLVAAGRWDDADEVISSAIAAPSVGPYRADLQRLAGTLALARGDLEAAEDALVRATGLLAGSGDRQHQLHLPHIQLRVELAAARGQFTAALSAARDALAAWDLQTNPRYSWSLLTAVAAVAADLLGTPPAARATADAELAAEVLAEARVQAAKLEINGPVQAARQLTFRAEIGRADGATADSRLLWWSAVAAWDELGEPLQLAYALYRAAEALLASPAHRAAAEAPLLRAAGIATEIGAGRLLADVGQLARRARIALPGHAGERQPATSALTPRETEVLGLMAAGASNAAIATELFISTKTVSVHVSSILAKLGAANRSEAAAIAHRQGLLAATD